MKKYELTEEAMKKGNNLFGELHFENCNISFKGNNNTLFVNGKITLKDSNIEFRGNNSLIYLCETDDIITLDVKVYHNSTFYLGKDAWINRGIKIVISEETNVFFGNDCLISYDTCIRTGDPHILYDCKTHQRLNHSKSVYIGDHVWIGQHAFLLKGAQIGSGTTIGAMTLVSGKKYHSNCAYGGNPAKLIKERVFFLKDDCHRFTEKEKQEYECCDKKDFTFEKDGNTVSFDEIDNILKQLDVEMRVEYLNKISENNNKNRFYI